VLTAVALLALAALLPFARGLLAGHCLFFRDLSLYSFPLRRWVVEGLRGGELRYWNPLVHEGKQELFPPVGYPIDLLQILLPDERGFTALLVLHVPLAAIAFFALARRLGLSVLASTGAGAIYALGGFSLSLVNLYGFLHAAAWAPLLVLSLLWVVQRRPAALAAAAVIFAITVATCAVEIVAQALLLALVVCRPHVAPGGVARVGGALSLGMGLSAPVWVVAAGALTGSGRGAGLSTEAVLAHSIHPVTFLQTLVANLHGDLLNPVGRWWGDLFFSGGFPYFLSFYLGATVVSLAILGTTRPSPYRRGLLLLMAAAAWVGLGAWGGWAPLVEAAPFLRRLRYPSKAFYTVHLTVTLLAAMGLDALVRSGEQRRDWKRFGWITFALGGVALVFLPSFFGFLPGRADFFRPFFPAHYLDSQVEASSGLVLRDAATGGAVALAAAVIAWMVCRRRLAPAMGAFATIALLTADLLRAGAGLNPMVTPAFFDLSSEMSRVVAGLNERGARVYSCHAPTSRAYTSTRPPQAEDRDVHLFTILRETLTPSFNLPKGPPTAFSSDLTGLVPLRRTLDPPLMLCSAVPAILDQLRAAAVSHVVSLDPLETEGLTLEEIVRPERIAPLAIHIYSLASPLPRWELAARVAAAPDSETAAERARELGFQRAGGVVVEGPTSSTGSRGTARRLRESTDEVAYAVDSDVSGVFVLRDAYAPGWRATVNRVEARILRADGRHRAVPVPPGQSRVVMSYRPPGLAAAFAVSAVGILATLASLRRNRRR